MKRAPAPRWLSTLSSLSLASLAYLALPQAEAEAANNKQKGPGFHEGVYVQVTPGSFVFPFAQDDFIDLTPTFGWGFGGGYMFARGKLFKATVGGVFEHTVLPFDNFNYRDFGAHVLRFMPEGRIGLGTDKVWGYGLLGAGVAGVLWRWNASFGGFGDLRGNNSAPGFNTQLGGGVQGIVWKNLFIGGEVDVDVGLYFEGDPDDWDNGDEDFGIYSVAFEVMVGWVF